MYKKIRNKKSMKSKTIRMILWVLQTLTMVPTLTVAKVLLECGYSPAVTLAGALLMILVNRAATEQGKRFTSSERRKRQIKRKR